MFPKHTPWHAFVPIRQNSLLFAAAPLVLTAFVRNPKGYLNKVNTLLKGKGNMSTTFVRDQPLPFKQYLSIIEVIISNLVSLDILSNV